MLQDLAQEREASQIVHAATPDTTLRSTTLRIHCAQTGGHSCCGGRLPLLADDTTLDDEWEQLVLQRSGVTEFQTAREMELEAECSRLHDKAPAQQPCNGS